MEHKILLGKYEVALDTTGAPVQLHANAAGATYKAQEIGSGREVSVELIPAGSLGAKTRAELETEAHSANQLNHINIPAFYDFGWEGDYAVYVTEYLDGISTEAWVKGHGPMAASAVLRVALQVLAALGAAAFHRIVHHAINPGNLMIVPGQTTEGGWPLIKVLHLVGVAPKRSVDPDSARFASPEQLQTGAVDLRSEIYSLGCTLQFLLTGIPPIANDQVEAGRMRLAVRRLKGVPKNVRRLVGQMAALDPQARPHDPIALYESIQDCLSQIERREALARKFGIVTTRRRPIESTVERRIPVGALAMAAGLLLLLGLATMALPERFGPRRLFGLKSGPVGVPIGVADTESQPPAIVTTAAPKTASPAGATQTASNTGAIVSASSDSSATASPAELFSTASADAGDPNATAQPARGDDTRQSASTTSAPVVTQNAQAADSEAPPAPAEGPSDRRDIPAVASNTQSASGSSQPPGAPPPAAPVNTSQAAANTGQLAGNDVSAVAQTRERDASPNGRDDAPDTAEGRSSPATPAVEPTSSRPVAAAPPPSESSAPSVTDQASGQLASNSTRPPQLSHAESREGNTAQRPGGSERYEMARASSGTVVAKQPKPKTVAKAKPGKNKQIRVARALPVDEGDGLPPLQAGTVRARVVGTTPDGRIVLAVPSGTATTAPVASDVPAEGPPPRRVRRAIPVPEFIPPPPPFPVFPPD